MKNKCDDFFFFSANSITLNVQETGQSSPAVILSYLNFYWSVCIVQPQLLQLRLDRSLQLGSQLFSLYGTIVQEDALKLIILTRLPTFIRYNGTGFIQYILIIPHPLLGGAIFPPARCGLRSFHPIYDASSPVSFFLYPPPPRRTIICIIYIIYPCTSMKQKSGCVKFPRGLEQWLVQQAQISVRFHHMLATFHPLRQTVELFL